VAKGLVRSGQLYCVSKEEKKEKVRRTIEEQAEKIILKNRATSSDT
jgi:hypothetical protein